MEDQALVEGSVVFKDEEGPVGDGRQPRPGHVAGSPARPRPAPARPGPHSTAILPTLSPNLRAPTRETRQAHAVGRPEGAPRAPRPPGRRGGPVRRPASRTLGLHVLPYGPREGAGGGAGVPEADTSGRCTLQCHGAPARPGLGLSTWL